MMRKNEKNQKRCRSFWRCIEMDKKYFADDRPRDYTKYINMPREKRLAEIARLEAEMKKEDKKKGA